MLNICKIFSQYFLKKVKNLSNYKKEFKMCTIVILQIRFFLSNHYNKEKISGFLNLSSSYIRSRDRRRFGIFPLFSEFCGGCSKTLYEAPGLKSHQIGQSWCQIKENLIESRKFCQFDQFCSEKCRISEGFGK